MTTNNASRSIIRFCFLTLIGLLLLSASVASAQTVVNPRTVEFLASPDHALTVNSTPVVDHYELTVVQQNNLGVLYFTQQLGKPVPASPVPPATEGLIGPINVPNFLNTTLPANIVALAFIDTVPTIGLNLVTVRSAASGPFVRLALRATGAPVVKQ